MRTTRGSDGSGVDQAQRNSLMSSIEILPSLDECESESNSGSKDDSSQRHDDESDEEDMEKAPPVLGGNVRDVQEMMRKARLLCGRIVNAEKFQFFIVVLIILNAIQMGVGTYDFFEENERAAEVFHNLDLAFLVIFTFELALNFGFHGWRLFQDGWLFFDFIVVFTSWSVSSIHILRSFRVFRAFRLIVKLDTLKNLILAVIAVMPRIASIMSLFVLMLYIFAVLCNDLFGDLWLEGKTERNYFTGLGWCLFTLFQFITLDEWGDPARDVMDSVWWSAFIFVIFIFITAFTFYNLIVAVVCDAVAVQEHPELIEAARHAKMIEEKTHTRKRMVELEAKLSDLSRRQMDVLNEVKTMLQTLADEELAAQSKRNSVDSLSCDMDNSSHRDHARIQMMANIQEVSNQLMVWSGGEDGSDAGS